MAISDETRELAAQVVARYPKPRSALLPLLHLVQSDEGYVSPEGIGLCAELLDLTKAEVGAVATFYTMYKRKPVGDYHVGVCTNTLCAIMGGDAIYDALKDHTGIKSQKGVSEDGKISLAELQKVWPKLTKATFDKYDANKDGFYNHAELAAYFKSTQAPKTSSMMTSAKPAKK